MITHMLPLAFTVIMNETPMELFIHGGPIMWPIVLVSFVLITVVVERIVFIIRENSSREPEVLAKMIERIDAHDLDGAIKIGDQSTDFVARIMVDALKHRTSSFTKAYVRATNQELARYQQGMVSLDTIVTLGPLLGLLGTITGMMKTFGALGVSTDIASSAGKITGGVAEALIATMCGLSIAILALLPHNYLNSRIDEAKHEIIDVANTVEPIVTAEVARKAHASA